MKHEKGQLVRNSKLGLGKVLAVSGDVVTVFFKDEKENPRKIVVSRVPLEVPENQSDPWLDNLDLATAAQGDATQYLTHARAVEKFLRYFPKGFYDPEYIGTLKSGERVYKWAAHELWLETLNEPEFQRLITQKSYAEVVKRALRVEQKSKNLLSSFEKAALKEATSEPADGEQFALGLHDLIYGKDEFENRFVRFADALDRLPQPKTPLRWTVQTIFPFLALPHIHLFLKPGVTQEAAQRRAFSLNYLSQPNWLTYSSLLKLGELLMRDLSHLKPRDMIDIQSFIFITGNSSYT